MERLVSPQLDCREITELTISKFKKITPIFHRTGHARFHRDPDPASTSRPTPQPMGLRPGQAACAEPDPGLHEADRLKRVIRYARQKQAGR
ncbi:hypothetical protein OPV22_032186 [Ensete ventricosum]|uniref:Uncharacterized protein n=1 Tax=Ensete ventricosum TaxID=4639 RepID=A0AAV8PP06_ENSVE|nr:hypothetical protein OPV22_032186 [Ensete ventricosum]